MRRDFAFCLVYNRRHFVGDMGKQMNQPRNPDGTFGRKPRVVRYHPAYIILAFILGIIAGGIL